MQTVELFAGVGGFALGFDRGLRGHQLSLLCELDPAAGAVLQQRFPGVPLVQDIRSLESLPTGTELVTAGFPCQDLSQAGKTNGIGGSKSGVVAHLFRLLAKDRVETVVIENVPFMLQLGRGAAIKYLVESLESLGYRWAYRIIDARAFGLPQRRERVFLIASQSHEPWNVLLRSEAAKPQDTYSDHLACGFYWTEGNRGLGWAVDAVPTLKGGSTIGIPSPPAIWLPNGSIIKPHLFDAERLQGFPADWTEAAGKVARPTHRWKLVGNAVSTRASEWVARCVGQLPKVAPAPARLTGREFDQSRTWPGAAFGGPRQTRRSVGVSTCAVRQPCEHLHEFLQYEGTPLSEKATRGFASRLKQSNLRYIPEFLSAIESHLAKASLVSA